MGARRVVLAAISLGQETRLALNEFLQKYVLNRMAGLVCSRRRAWHRANDVVSPSVAAETERSPRSRITALPLTKDPNDCFR